MEGDATHEMGCNRGQVGGSVLMGRSEVKTDGSRRGIVERGRQERTFLDEPIRSQKDRQSGTTSRQAAEGPRSSMLGFPPTSCANWANLRVRASRALVGLVERWSYWQWSGESENRGPPGLSTACRRGSGPRSPVLLQPSGSSRGRSKQGSSTQGRSRRPTSAV